MFARYEHDAPGYLIAPQLARFRQLERLSIGGPLLDSEADLLRALTTIGANLQTLDIPGHKQNLYLTAANLRSFVRLPQLPWIPFETSYSFRWDWADPTLCEAIADSMP